MAVFAAVMTEQGVGAISTIQVFGNTADTVIKAIFEPLGGKTRTFKPGQILLGHIVDGSETIDQVTIGCEGDGNFAINCHGNPLIVADITGLLGQHGVSVVTTEQLLAKILSAQGSSNTIATEAKLAQPNAKTIQGAKIIANQITAGLSKKAMDWRDNINTIPLDRLTADAERILEKTRTAKLIIEGCTAAITGPPNSGKSTLLNCLAGRTKAIVTDIKGTTRDWVSCTCKIGSLSIELIDTAGLNETLLTGSGDIEKAAQNKSMQILEKADLVLLVLDSNQTNKQLDDWLVKKIAHKKILTVLNKTDLPLVLVPGDLPGILSNTINISAKNGTGIDNLTGKIPKLLGIEKFDLKAAVCVTGRQEKLVAQLSKAKSASETASTITELLDSQPKPCQPKVKK